MSNIGAVGITGIEALYYELEQLQDETRDAARAARREAQHDQIDSLMEQADHIEEQAWLQGVGQIASGVSQMMGAVAQGGALGKASTAETDGARQIALKEGDQAQAAFQAMGSIDQGLLSAAAGTQGAAAQRSAARATAASSRADDAREVESDSRQAAERVRRALETRLETQRELRATLVRA